MALNSLVLDSAGARCVIALGRADQVLGSVSVQTREGLSANVISEMQSLLKRCELELRAIDLFGIGVGPGGFTGLRVGMATIKAIAFTNSKPLVGVDSLYFLARTWPSSYQNVLVIREAYRGEVYAAIYQLENGNWTQAMEPKHGKPEDLAPHMSGYAKSQNAVVGGSGYWKYKETWLDMWKCDVPEMPLELDDVSAEALIAVALEQYQKRGVSDLFTLEPMYVRPADAVLATVKKSN